MVVEGEVVQCAVSANPSERDFISKTGKICKSDLKTGPFDHEISNSSIVRFKISMS